MNNPYLDYLRLATWNITEYTYLLSQLYKEDLFAPGKWLQYRGKRSSDGHIFHGIGPQGTGKYERRHAIIQFSGSAAQTWRQTCRQWQDFYCTRLDVQVTIEEPKEHNGRALYRAINRKAKSMIESPGAITCYIGNRRSNLFTRIYEKPIDGQRFLRCEFELKSDYARSAWDNYKSGHTTVAEIYASCFEKARIPLPWREWFLVNADSYPNLLESEQSKDLRGKLNWLLDTETAIERMFCMHETRGAVISTIERLSMLLGYIE